MEAGEQVDHVLIIPNQNACSNTHKNFLIICNIIYLRSFNCRNNFPWVIPKA